MIHLTCRLTAKNRDQLHDPTLGNRVWATFTFYSTGRETSREGRLPAHCNVLVHGARGARAKVHGHVVAMQPFAKLLPSLV